MGLVTPSYFAGMPIKIEEPNISNKHITWEKIQLAKGRPFGYLQAWPRI